MSIRNLTDAKRLLSGVDGTIIGVGMTAYSRIAPSYFLPSYNIIAAKKTGDLSHLRSQTQVFCLEEAQDYAVTGQGFNSFGLLSNPLVKEVIKGLPGPRYLFLYQSYPKLEALAEKEGWIPVANPSSLRTKVAGRAFFRNMAKELNLEKVPGGVYPIHSLYDNDYDFWAEMISSRFVVQLPEVRQGGGRGTFFINGPADYERLREGLKDGLWRGSQIKTLAIRRFIEGDPVSFALCITRHGVLISELQRQLTDLPYCDGLMEKGIFCGHSWDKGHWSGDIKNQAKGQAERICASLKAMGYRGILGIDFIVDNIGERVYPIEINPRFTGAFPMLSQLYMRKNVIPMEVFHILEFLDIHYDIDIESLNRQYAETVKGSHIILFRLDHKREIRENPPGAGLYEYDEQKGEAFFLKAAFDFNEIMNDRQFILIDGPPLEMSRDNNYRDPLGRLCRLLFSFSVVDKAGKISEAALNSAKWCYDRIMEKRA